VKYNAVISVDDVSTDSGEITYPITRQEFKDYARLEGFTDADESTTESLSDFDFDDDLIDDVIAAVTEMFELKCGLSLYPKTLESVLTNLQGMQELPRGPIGSADISIVDCNGNDVAATSIKTVGGMWKFLKSPCYEDMAVTYEAGYGATGCPPVPKSIKIDLLRAAYYFYMNRGSEASKLFVSQLAAKHSRNTWLA
jgi:hypothetical protein